MEVPDIRKQLETDYRVGHSDMPLQYWISDRKMG